MRLSAKAAWKFGKIAMVPGETTPSTKSLRLHSIPTWGTVQQNMGTLRARNALSQPDG